MTRNLLLLLAVGCFLLPGRGTRAVDYLRGDANSDGKVTISDTHFIENFLFRGRWPSDCLRAMDPNADGKIDIADGIWILNHLFRNGPAPMAPFPDPGPDAAAGEAATALPCDAYDLVPPLEDPSARVTVLDAVATGGEDAQATIVVAVSSSTPLAGFSGVLIVDSAVVGTVEASGEDLLGLGDGNGFNDVTLSGSRLTFGFLTTLVKDNQIPAGVDASVFEITVCLKDGAAPGDYSLHLEEAELVDFDSGRAIRPATTDGTLTLLDAVAAGAGCEPGDPGGGDCTQPIPDPLPPLVATFQIRGGRAPAGSEVTLPFSILANAPVQAYSFSIDFDEEVLDASGVDVRWDIDGANGFKKVEIQNGSSVPGSGGVDEGFIVGALVFSFHDNCHVIPANAETVALDLRFRVRPGTEETSTEVAFLDGGKVSGQPLRNMLTAYGAAVPPETAGSYVFINGLVDVLPEIVVFIRGDSNGDSQVDISDAQTTLGYLFQGTERPKCLDAADSNDDGAINVSDPITTLAHLFLGGPSLPAPFPGEGTDPTEDAITCSAWIR